MRAHPVPTSFFFIIPTLSLSLFLYLIIISNKQTDWEIVHKFLPNSKAEKNMSDNDGGKSEEVENLEVMKQESSMTEMQEARAFLRERFLQCIKGCIGRKATFHLHENSQVSGEFRGADVDFQDIFVRNLETPLGKIPEAIIRATDVLSVDIKNISLSS